MNEPAIPPRLAALEPHLRIDFGNSIRLGPGKIALLKAIAETGSISAAGRALSMSYRRAWLLVDELSSLFQHPVVTASAGGTHGGGAQITEFGHALMAAYQRIEARTRQAIQEEMAPFASDLAPLDDQVARKP